MRLRVVFMVLDATGPVTSERDTSRAGRARPVPAVYRPPRQPTPTELACEQWLNPGRVPNIGEAVIIDVRFEEQWLCRVTDVVTENDCDAMCCTCTVRRLERR